MSTYMYKGQSGAAMYLIARSNYYIFHVGEYGIYS